MSSAYYPDEPRTRERSRRTYYREERRDERDPRYLDPRDNYLNVGSRDLVPRPREDSDLSVEEVQRDFPPPGYARDIRRARSAGPYDDYDDRRSYYDHDERSSYDRDYDRRARKAPSAYSNDEDRKRARVLGRQEQILAAIAGAAVAIGGKELYDRREAKQEGTDVHRNVLASAALGAAGAFAGYQGTEFYNKHQKKSSLAAHKGRDGHAYYSDDDDDDSKSKSGHKNFLEGALAAAGLGGAVKALTGGSSHDERKSNTRSRRGSDASSRSKGRGEGASRMQKAAMASLIAGATEAFRVSKEPGGWKGEKTKRILTAAAGAATIDAAQNPEKSGKLGLAEAVIGGLVGNRVINGSRKNIEEDERTGRSRSRSRARSEGGRGGGATGLAALATAGLGALGAKKIIDSHERSRSRRRSADSYDSRDPSPDRRRRQRSRSRSVVDSARRGLAKLGIGNGPDDDHDEPRGSHRSRRYDPDDEYDDYSRGSGRDRGGRDRDYDDDRSHGRRDHSRSRQVGGGRGRDSSRGSHSETDLGDSEEDERREKKMRDGRRRH